MKTETLKMVLADLLSASNNSHSIDAFLPIIEDINYLREKMRVHFINNISVLDVVSLLALNETIGTWFESWVKRAERPNVHPAILMDLLESVFVNKYGLVYSTLAAMEGGPGLALPLSQIVKTILICIKNMHSSTEGIYLLSDCEDAVLTNLTADLHDYRCILLEVHGYRTGEHDMSYILRKGDTFLKDNYTWETGLNDVQLHHLYFPFRDDLTEGVEVIYLK